MKITILGSGTGVPSLKRGAPGLIVKIGKDFLLFDSGPGTLNRLLEAKIDYLKLDYIFYSHFHPDHVAELVPFLFACKYNSTPREKKLKLVGPKGLENFYFSLLKVYGEWITPSKFSVEINELNGEPYQTKDWIIHASPMKHTDPCVGYRIETAGKTIVYSGDTDYCREIVELAKNSDLFISECSFPEKHRLLGHLTPRLAGKVAKESGCKHLVLTHLYPICDKFNIRSECRREYSGKLTIAKDLMKFVI
jgi:ribonuclease BN (tRNA processing enzyme)